MIPYGKQNITEEDIKTFNKKNIHQQEVISH